MEAIPAKLPKKLLQGMDDIIEEGWYANRSDLIRDAVRDIVKRMKSERLEAAIKEDVAWGLHGKD